MPVSINQVSRVDVALELGNLTETVTVQSESSLLQTDKAEMHTEIKSAAIVGLPLGQLPELPGADQPGARGHAGHVPEQRGRHAGPFAARRS